MIASAKVTGRAVLRMASAITFATSSRDDVGLTPETASDLALAVLGRRAEAERRPEMHLGDLAQEDRGPVVVGGHDGVGDVVDAAELRVAADDERLAVFLDVAGAERAVVALEHLVDLRQRQLVLGELLGIDDDLVLLGLAAHGVDLDDAGDRAQPVGHHPVEQRPQLHRRVLVAAQIEFVDLSEARRHRRQLGPSVPFGDVGLGELEPLGDELPREPDVGVVVEHDGDHADRGAAARADLDDAGETVHRRLDRVGQEALDLGGRQPRRRREHLHLRVGHVGDRVDR
jgi:hypothetical protein